MVVGVVGVYIVGDAFKTAADTGETVGYRGELSQVGAGDAIDGGDGERGVVAADRAGESEAWGFGDIFYHGLALGAEGREGVEVILLRRVGVGMVVGY